MSTADFFRARLDAMIDLNHPLAILRDRILWEELEIILTPFFTRTERSGNGVVSEDLFGSTLQIAGGGVTNAGRPRLPIRLMVALIMLKHTYNESDESVVERWAQDVYFQYFSGLEYFEARKPCDPTQIGRFRRAIGEVGMAEILARTVNAAVKLNAIAPKEFETIIVDTTVQEKAIAYPTDSRLLEVERVHLVREAKRSAIALKQTFAKEGKALRRSAGGYAHAKQFKRLRKTLKRQRTIVGKLIREIRGKMGDLSDEAKIKLATLLERAERLVKQQPQDKNKLYALHAPEVECISKGKAKNPYEFGVKTSLAITHKQGLIVGAKTFTGNPYDGHTLAEQIEQTNIILMDHDATVKTVYADLGYQGVDESIDTVTLIHRGKSKSLSKSERKKLKRRQAIEPAIGHIKQDHGMRRCWLKGQIGDALHALSCAIGFNIRWLLRAIVRLGVTPFFALMFLRYYLGYWLKNPSKSSYQFA